jgi:hypothetical protein
VLSGSLPLQAVSSCLKLTLGCYKIKSQWVRSLLAPPPPGCVSPRTRLSPPLPTPPSPNQERGSEPTWDFYTSFEVEHVDTDELVVTVLGAATVGQGESATDMWALRPRLPPDTHPSCLPARLPVAAPTQRCWAG